MASLTDTVDAQKRAVLAAGAQAGQAGVAAYQQAQQSIQADREAALARAHAASNLIGAAGTNATVDELIGRPSALIGQALAGEQAGFSTALGTNQAAQLSNLDRLAAQEPLIAARAAEAAASRGGGGGGGGKAPQTLADLSDSELRNVLVGQARQDQAAAAQQAGQAVQAATGKIVETKGAQRATRQSIRKEFGRKVARQVYRQPARRAAAQVLQRVDVRRPVPGRARLAPPPGGYPSAASALPGGLMVAPPGSPFEATAQAQRLARATRALPARPGPDLGRLRALIEQRRGLAHQIAGQSRAARAAYASAAGGLGTPLADYAANAGIAAGLDPNRVLGVTEGIPATTEAKSKLKAEDVLGGLPLSNPRAAARDVSLNRRRVAQLRLSRSYTVLARSARQAAQSGVSLDEFVAKQLDSPVSMAALTGRTGPGGKDVKIIPTRDNKALVRLLTYDVAPLFGAS